MAVPPIIEYIVLAGTAIGLLSPLLLAAKGQSGRPGAVAGILAGALFSIPVGLLAGMFFWSVLEEATAMPSGLELIVGPLIGCFLGTYAVSLLTREFGARIAEMREHRSENPSN